MSGIGGWLAGSAKYSAEHLAGVFKDALTSANGLPVRSWQSDAAGLAITDAPQIAALHTSGVHSVAIFGRPRWVEAAQSETAIEGVCHRLLEAYRARNTRALESLHGDFALAIVNAETNEVLLAVDRFNIRNLVYQADAQGLIFGSTCDIVCAHPNAGKTVDPQAIYDYTYFHAVPGPRTIYRGQQRLLPGHCLTWANGRASVQPYWAMKFAEQRGSVADFKPRFRQVLKEAVATAARDSTCGAFLSGGTDSSTVAGTLGDVSGKSAQTYSIGFAVEGYDEMEYARIASRHFGTEQHEYYLTPEDVVSALPLIAGAYDQHPTGPFACSPPLE